MKKEKERKHFIEKPVYPGGDKALTEFIYKQLRYPKAAAEAKVTGTVYLEYGIDYQGNVADVRVIQGLGHGCDEEAARVVKMLKFDVGKYRGINVLFHKKARIDFRPAARKAAPLPEKSPQQQQAQQFQLQYTLVPKPAPESPTEVAPSPEPVYTYTVVLG